MLEKSNGVRLDFATEPPPALHVIIKRLVYAPDFEHREIFIRSVDIRYDGIYVTTSEGPKL